MMCSIRETDLNACETQVVDINENKKPIFKKCRFLRLLFYCKKHKDSSVTIKGHQSWFHLRNNSKVVRSAAKKRGGGTYLANSCHVGIF